MKKFLLLTVILFSLPVLAYPQVSGTDSKTAKKQMEYKHNIGASAGYIAGPGISYRYWINDRYGVQTALYPYYYKHDGEKDVNLSAGLMGLRILSETERLNLFAYLGARVQHKSHSSRNNGGDPYETNDDYLHVGGGPGIEIKVSRLSLNAMVGIRGKTDFKQQQEISFSAEGGIYYRF